MCDPRRRGGQAAGDDPLDLEIGEARGIAVGDDRVDFGVGDDAGEMLRPKVGGDNDHPSRDAVEVEEREGSGELLAGDDGHR